MRINTNVSSITAQEAAANTNKKITSSLAKLSSGLQINKASDDASGLAIADKLRTQATSIDQGVTNGNSAITLLQIADKSMAEQSNILDTVKAKLIQANTDTTSDAGRESIRKDINKLLEQLDNIAEQTNYNGNVLLQSASNDKSASSDLAFQIGESKNDIIKNTAIQSNTDGLGGGADSITSGGTAVTTGGNEINQGASMEVKEKAGGTITIKAYEDLLATNATGALIENVRVSGEVGQIASSDGSGAITLSNVDEGTRQVLDTLIGVFSGLAGTGTGSSKTYSFTSGTLDLKDLKVSSMDISTAAGTGSIEITTSENIKVKNISTTSGSTTVDGTDIVGGDLLSSMSALKEGELTKELADKFQGVVDTAITELNGYRGDVGSTQNQVESAVRNLMTQSTNVKAAESIIRDVDYAAESANFNKQNIISQAGSYAISQANSVQQNVLRLLQ